MIVVCIFLLCIVLFCGLTNAIRPYLTSTSIPITSCTSVPSSSLSPINNKSKSSYRIAKIALSGGLAGGLTNAILFPIDTLKIIRQSDPSVKSLWGALKKLQEYGFKKAYRGIVPAAVGAIPSSAIYFGTYESLKLFLQPLYSVLPRHLIHMLAAGTGNLLSSLVLVPKDLMKIRMQAGFI